MNTKKGFNTRVLVACGLLASISIVLTRLFSYMIPLAGLPALRIGFGDIPVIISGMLFGPIAGGLTGGVSDLLGFILNPMGGPYIPGFTISAVLRGLIPGLIYWLIRTKNIKFNFHIANIIFSILLAIGILFVFLSQEVELSKVLMMLYGAIALAFIMIPVVLSRIIKSKDSLYSFDKILFIVTVGYFIISLGLNTLWLAVTYEKGFLAFLPGRILAGFVMIPLHSIMIFVLSRWFKYIKIS
ncbi:MAG: folate family ECF transporter S component [Epulopiscium sp.]|nr:folate family ECF transporter S component [Candidatus Epulonipiscium sp.]